MDEIHLPPPEATEKFRGPPLVAGTVVGYRSWFVMTDYLKSVIKPFFWGPGENQATCLRLRAYEGAYTHTGVAIKYCACGFYAFYGQNLDYHDYHGPFQSVSGLIEGYGVTTLGQLGFRCAKARIIALQLNRNCQLMDLIAKRYDVPVYPNFLEMTEQHPLGARIDE